MLKALAICVALFTTCSLSAQESTKLVQVAEGWAGNSINTVIFRKNSLATHKDTQFVAFYNKDGYVVLGKRKLGTDKWVLKQTPYQGNIADAHNTISIAIDGEGYLHMAWDHHNHPLRYVKSTAPGSLELTQKMQMTGAHEESVSYPEFYKMANGNLLFLYRDGASGKGNLVMNAYDIKSKSWQQLHNNLIDGEGKRNAYWQACVDERGTIHISWVWRESPNVASNHDLCYARSLDGGKTWEKTDGTKYKLPITASTAEYAWHIDQNSELINQTSMTTDKSGAPFITTYWRNRSDSVPQYRLIYYLGARWHTMDLKFRSTPFSLSGQGTKRIPTSRPQILINGRGMQSSAILLFRDEARGNKASAAYTKRLGSDNWKMIDLTDFSLGSWEPTYDIELWKNREQLNLFVQNVDQVDGEGKSSLPPQMIYIFEWKP